MRLLAIAQEQGGMPVLPEGISIHACRFLGEATKRNIVFGLFEIGATKAQVTALKALPTENFLWLLVKQSAGRRITDSQGRRGITDSGVEYDDVISDADLQRIQSWLTANEFGFTLTAGDKWRVVMRFLGRRFGYEFDADNGWIVDPEES